MATRLTNRAERLIALEQLLFRSTAGLRAVEIADACSVDRRTVYRDLALLEEIGVPVFQRDGRFYIDREHYLATLRLSMDETVALLFAATESAQQTPHLGSAIAKLGQVLPTPFISDSMHLEPSAAPLIEAIAGAWRERRGIKVWYTVRDGTKLRVCELTHYFTRRQHGEGETNETFLVGLDGLSGRVRALKFSRLRKVEALGHQEAYEIRRHPFYVRGSTKSDDAELG